MMHDDHKYIALRIALSDQMTELSGDTILAWLDYMPNAVVFRCLADVVREFLLCGIDPEATDWEVAQGLLLDSEEELHIDVRYGDVVLIDVMGMVVWQAEIPEWLLRLSSVIELMVDVYGRPIFAREFRDTLIGLWHPHMY